MSENAPYAPHQILRLAAETVPTMQEHEFVTKWLLTLREYVAGGDVKIGLWLQANDINVFTEVVIVDASGVELYRVPSIFVNQDKVLSKNVAESIGDILYRAENMNKVMPGRGDNYIQTEITDSVRTQTELPEYQRRWDEIFVRYELEPVFDTSATISNSNTPDDSGDFDDYEEL